MKTLLLIALMTVPTMALANVDNNCMSQCSNNGYTYNYCVSQCTYSPYQYPPKQQATDYMCMNKCSANGHAYGYCKQVCSY